MPRVATKCDVTEGKRVRIMFAQKMPAQCIYESTVITAAAEVNGLAIPVRWQIDLKADRRRAQILRPNLSNDLAE